MSLPHVVRSLAALRERLGAWRRESAQIALVPTMGALHEGHLALVREASTRAPRVVVSLFVNPTQFAPHEDFDAYPRTEAQDLARLALTPAALVYAPGVAEVYPEGHATTVSLGGPALGLESEARPHFFSGVATVVTKLFIHVAPDIAIFGEKDYQQLLVIRRLTRDLGLPIAIHGVATVREADGLALSSRNAYLTPDERAQAPALHRVIADIADAVRAGAPLERALVDGRARLAAAGFGPIDYIAIRDAETLTPVLCVERPARVLAAARLGRTRLIDNVPLLP